ncbi:MAG: aminotransferase class V-fold PLP-dependent enzyme [Phycisphaeraceae bacterium]|nr:aminotransferase class V-fold PLP-dependent enzyme [Phycisphaeraceae bacterium]
MNQATVIDPSQPPPALLATPRQRRDAAPQQAPFWSIDPALTFLNHGSYGALPREAMAFQTSLRQRMEQDPVRFYKADLEGLLDGMREDLAGFINCRAADLAPLPNATVALCTILANTRLEAGDEILITDHEYQSLVNELERVAARTGAVIVRAKTPFPVGDAGLVVERFMAGVTPRTRLAFISHVTSCTSLVLPVAAIVREFNRLGIDICVDGAHAPGQIPVDVRALAPTYYVGSGHKWLCGPKGTGFLYVRADKQRGFRPLQLSSRANKVRPERALYLRDFDYQGTDDYSGILTLPVSIKAVGGLMEGGWPALLRRNHETVLSARAMLARMLGDRITAVTAPAEMVGTMTSVILPEPGPRAAAMPTRYDDPLQDALLERHGVVAPVWRFGEANLRVLRISAQHYNTPAQYERLGAALAEELDNEQR